MGNFDFVGTTLVTNRIPAGIPHVWYDSRNIDGFGNATLTDGQGIARRVNLGSYGSQYDQGQGTSAARPLFRLVASAGKLNNMPGIESTGTQYLATSVAASASSVPVVPATSSQPMTIATVLKVTDHATAYYLYTGFTEGNQVELIANYNGANTIKVNNGAGGFALTGQSFTDNTFFMSVLVLNGASSYHRLNGSQSSNFNTASVAFTGVTTFGSHSGAFISKSMEIVHMRWVGGIQPAPSDIETLLTNWFGSFPQ